MSASAPQGVALEIVTTVRGEEVERRLIGRYPSRRAAKRAALRGEHGACLRAWPSHLSTVALGSAEIGGREHGWLTAALEDAERRQETVADRLASHGYFAM